MRLVVAVALLALVGCKGGWTKCEGAYGSGTLYVQGAGEKLDPTSKDDAVSGHGPGYRIVGTDPTTVEWRDSEGFSGVIVLKPGEQLICL
jgi:hypothetical protein